MKPLYFAFPFFGLLFFLGSFTTTSTKSGTVGNPAENPNIGYWASQTQPPAPTPTPYGCPATIKPCP